MKSRFLSSSLTSHELMDLWNWLLLSGAWFADVCFDISSTGLMINDKYRYNSDYHSHLFPICNFRFQKLYGPDSPDSFVNEPPAVWKIPWCFVYDYVRGGSAYGRKQKDPESGRVWNCFGRRTDPVERSWGLYQEIYPEPLSGNRSWPAEYPPRRNRRVHASQSSGLSLSFNRKSRGTGEPLFLLIGKDSQPWWIHGVSQGNASYVKGRRTPRPFSLKHRTYAFILPDPFGLLAVFIGDLKLSRVGKN